MVSNSLPNLSGLSGSVSQSFTIPSSLLLARVFPSGENATAQTSRSCPVSWVTSVLLSTFQSLMVLSSLLDASNLPLGEKSTQVAGLVCPLRVAIGLPVFTFQSFTVASSPQLARILPSGEKANDLTASVWPWSVISFCEEGSDDACRGSLHNLIVLSTLLPARIFPFAEKLSAEIHP